jgi:hypothetical protein
VAAFFAALAAVVGIERLFRTTAKVGKHLPATPQQRGYLRARLDMGTERVADPLNSEWVTVLFLAALVAVAWINLISPRKWRLLWSTIVRARLGRQTLREDIDLQDRTLIALVLVSVVITGLFGYQFAVLRGVMVPGILGFWGITGAVLGVVLLQLTVIKAVSWLFNADQGLGEYFRTMVLLQVVLGLGLWPIALLGAYQSAWRPWLMSLGGVLVLVVVVVRWGRAFVIGRGHGNKAGPILLYLCAAEILPAAIALRSLQHLLPFDVQPI